MINFVLLNGVLLSDTYPGQMETYPHKNLYTNVPSSFIHNSPKLETIQSTFYE